MDMFIYRFMAGVIAAAALTWASPGSAGWVIDETAKGGAGGRQQVMMQANRIKSVVFEGGKPVSAFVVDLDAQTLTQVDYKERYYFTATVQEYVQTFRGAMSGVMKEMQEALKGMSAEDRKVMEQMMPQQAQPDCREPRTELRKTGQQTTVAGYPATRYDLLEDGKAASELWIAKGITAWRELDGKKLERFMAQMAKLAGCPGQGRRVASGADQSWKLAGEGYPVRTVERRGGTMVEVVKAERRAIPAEEFQPPAGFARKSLREVMKL